MILRYINHTVGAAGRSVGKFIWWSLTLRLAEELRIRRDACTVALSGLFDSHWYVNQNSDVARVTIDPALHYVTWGVRENRPPSPVFDTGYYWSRRGGLPEEPRAHLTQSPEKGTAITSFSLRAINPILDYLEHGRTLHLSPHHLFDPEFYLSQLPSSHRRAGERSPMGHYMKIGHRLGFSPHPELDITYYLQHNPEVAESGENPLVHFLQFGAAEGRDPSETFSCKRYLQRYPDVGQSGLNPLVHYVACGKREGRNPSPPPVDALPTAADELQRFLPAAHNTSFSGLSTPPSGGREVLIIIPVYRGVDETERCVTSVLKARTNIPHTLLLINDCSPEREMNDYLSQLQAAGAETGRVKVITNEHNLGFVGTVNRGLKEHVLATPTARDVLLLNSDTEVSDYWLDALVAHTAVDSDSDFPRGVGTITPLSNNATICSYPQIGSSAELPPGESVHTLAEAASTVNQGRSVHIPTGVGFCMFITHECLTEVGVLDEEAFGKGYGEEVDFCLRATKAGWGHLLALDAFVYHKGGTSFQSSQNELQERAQRVLGLRYPDYVRSVSEFVERDPARGARVALTAQRIKASPLRKVAIITHALGGGVEEHIRTVARASSEEVIYLTLRQLPDTTDPLVRIESLDAQYPLSLTCNLETHGARGGEGQHEILLESLPGSSSESPPESFLGAFLRSCGVTSLHIHHTFGMMPALNYALAAMDIPYEVTIHDYYFVCPQVSLTTPQGTYCGEPELEGCTACLLERPHPFSRDIISWRLYSRALLIGAERIICPSIDTASRLQRYFPELTPLVVPHERECAGRISPALLTPGSAAMNSQGAPIMKVCVLGVVSAHKGARILSEVHRFIAEQSLPLTLQVIGYGASDLSEPLPEELLQTGPYLNHELPRLLTHAAPQVVWFPAQWPETYSYTLSHALAGGFMIVAPNLGAFSERLSRDGMLENGSARVIPWDSSREVIVAVLMELRERWIAGNPAHATHSHRHSSEHAPYAAPLLSPFYGEEYPLPASPTGSDDASGKSPVDASFSYRKRRASTEADTLRLLVFPEQHGESISPCSYIRLLHPLAHDKALSVELGRGGEPLGETPDLVIVGRTAIPTLKESERVLDWCKQRGIPLVFDIDDDLLSMEGHPEYERYLPLQQSIELLLRESDMVWTSTDPLREVLSPYSQRVVTVPNSLDERLWGLKPSHTPRKPGADSTVEILYMGTVTHQGDFALIAPALEEVVRSSQGRVRCSLIGAIPDRLTPPWAHRINVPPQASRSYPAYVRWLTTLSPGFDIGVCPLEETRFNQSKSDIKFLDYVALGATPISSDTPAYRTIARHGTNSLLAGPSVEEWRDALLKLVQQKALREELHRRAYEEVAQFRTVQATAAARLTLITGLLSSCQAKP